MSSLYNENHLEVKRKTETNQKTGRNREKQNKMKKPQGKKTQNKSSVLISDAKIENRPF